ncbi:hypothetical protein B296_00046210 [Ensete ventricosum]|uniref:Uncharacterized protein n=1 Tax=Ensete ventricosum TaxID=4639 RepID=A0A426Z1K3_ENSVE|nr:hypothetical protein B296_00046210 [Ensete ventricosum]
MQVLPRTRLTFYGPKKLKVHMVSMAKADEFYHPVEIFIRPPIPVGKAGEEWYQYQELTEKEEESRPKWFY